MSEANATSRGPAIVARGLRKSFGDVVALDGVDLAAPAGTVFGLLGPNGAGKTTAVKILTTLLPPDEGSAKVGGLDVVRQADELRSRIGLTGQYAAVDEYLTGRETWRCSAACTTSPRTWPGAGPRSYWPSSTSPTRPRGW